MVKYRPAESSPVPKRRFLDALDADPSVATCSILASKLADTAYKLVPLDSESSYPIDRDYIVAEPEGWYHPRLVALRNIGQMSKVDSGPDLHVSREVIVGDRIDAALYAGVRDDVLIRLANFAQIGDGPCNYVQFPGEISLDSPDIVATPVDAEKRKVLLKDMSYVLEDALVPPSERRMSGEMFSNDSLSGSDIWLDMGRKRRQRAKQALLDYMLSSGDAELPAFEQLRKSWPQSDKVNAQGAVLLAYAAAIGRCPSFCRASVGGSSVIKEFYGEALRLLQSDPRSIPEVEFGFAQQPWSLSNYLRNSGLVYAAGREEPLQDLKQHIEQQFQAVFDRKYEKLHERVLTKVFQYEDGAVVRKMVKDGYSPSAGVVADVEYELSIMNGFDPFERDLRLTSRIPSLRDSTPTLSGMFVASRVGSLQGINGLGEPYDLDSEQLAELADILSGDDREPTGPREQSYTFKHHRAIHKQKRTIERLVSRSRGRSLTLRGII